VHRIVQSDDERFRELFHGTTIHGRQRVGTGSSVTEALTYYHRTGPAGDVFANLPHGRVAVVGLGVGSLAAYADADTRLTFYEIDREVRWAAEESGYFNFLSKARLRRADIDIILGDARLTLASAPDASYDLLVLDAFSGDAVPAHLLTREAMKLYLRKLAPGGVVAVHISNVYLDLKPVLAAVAKDANCAFAHRDDIDLSPRETLDGKSPSQWIVISRSPETLQPLLVGDRWHRSTANYPRPWTDDFSDVLSIMRWRR
jgi:spermidine synthase